jgi:hypothetical protein
MDTIPVVGMKYDSDKPQFSLLKPEALWELVKVLTFGAKKYSPDNWKLLENSQQRYFDAAQRHMWQWKQGEKLDSESKYHHLAHAMASLMFIMQMDIEQEQLEKIRQAAYDSPIQPHGY